MESVDTSDSPLIIDSPLMQLANASASAERVDLPLAGRVKKQSQVHSKRTSEDKDIMPKENRNAKKCQQKSPIEDQECLLNSSQNESNKKIKLVSNDTCADTMKDISSKNCSANSTESLSLRKCDNKAVIKDSQVQPLTSIVQNHKEELQFPSDAAQSPVTPTESVDSSSFEPTNSKSVATTKVNTRKRRLNSFNNVKKVIIDKIVSKEEISKDKDNQSDSKFNSSKINSRVEPVPVTANDNIVLSSQRSGLSKEDNKSANCENNEVYSPVSHMKRSPNISNKETSEKISESPLAEKRSGDELSSVIDKKSKTLSSGKSTITSDQNVSDSSLAKNKTASKSIQEVSTGDSAEATKRNKASLSPSKEQVHNEKSTGAEKKAKSLERTSKLKANKDNLNLANLSKSSEANQTEKTMASSVVTTSITSETESYNMSKRPRRNIKAKRIFSESLSDSNDDEANQSRKRNVKKKESKKESKHHKKSKLISGNHKKLEVSEQGEQDSSSRKKNIQIKSDFVADHFVPIDFSSSSSSSSHPSSISSLNENKYISIVPNPKVKSSSSKNQNVKPLSSRKAVTKNIEKKCSYTKINKNSNKRAATVAGLKSFIKDTTSNGSNHSGAETNTILPSNVNCCNPAAYLHAENMNFNVTDIEKFIKKEPTDITELNEPTNSKGNKTELMSNGCNVGVETQELRKLLNTTSNAPQVMNTNTIIPSGANSTAQPIGSMKIGPVSPYAIFLPVSLPSGPTVATNPSITSNNIQLNVPRKEKPLLPNDNFLCAKSDGMGNFINSKQVKFISRTNPIPAYFPAPLPKSLVDKLTVNYHSCAECGDTFLFKSSLNIHKSRKCMQITYNCDNCTMKLIFYNKCSMLEHIRSHYPSQAVTIKLDKMEIVPLPENITDILEIEDQNIDIQKSSDENNNFDCFECGAKFNTARSLANHFGNSESICSFTYYCGLCQSYLPTHCAQKSHRRIHHEKSPHICPECGALVSDLASFRHHLKYKCVHFSRVAPLTCPKCLAKFCYSPELKDHIISIHSETFIKCSICPMAFKTKSFYRNHHQNIHLPEQEQKKEIYKCPLCDTVFHNIQQLMNHIDVHINDLKVGVEYAFRCSICSSIFDKRSVLLSHLSSCHRLDFIKHRCEFCDCVCKTAYNLQTHQKAIHKIEFTKTHGKPETKKESELMKLCKEKGIAYCSLCQIFFANDAQLQVHSAKVHESKKGSGISAKARNSRKVCQYCHAPYKSWNRLMQHILGHRQSGVYMCLMCTNAAFLTREELHKHEELCCGEITLGNLPTIFECKDCHELFKVENWLIAHQKNIHSKKSMFPCHLCHLCCKSNDALLKHILESHEKKKHTCQICKEMNKEKSFQRKIQLERHISSKHKTHHNKSSSGSTAPQPPPNEEVKSCKQSDIKEQVICIDLDDQPVKELDTREEESSYSCTKCTFSSKDYNLFQIHIQEHQTVSEGMQCSECGLGFTAVDSLRMHLFLVHKIKQSNEELSNPGLVNKKPENTPQVSSQQLPNTEDNMTEQSECFECNVCYKAFESEHLLKIHLRTHGMAFIRSKRLNLPEAT